MAIQIDVEALRSAFFEDTAEHLAGFERSILALEKNPDDVEALNVAFRAVHTIKGSGGIFPFPDLLSFAHDFESFLEYVRDRKDAVTAMLITLLLEGSDHLKALVDYYREAGEGPAPGDLTAITRTLHVRFQQYLAEAPPENAAVSGENVAFIVRAKPVMFQHGLSMESALSYLLSEGGVRAVRVLTENIPDLSTYDPGEAFLAVEISFESGISSQTALARLQDAFELLLRSIEITEVLPEPPVAEQREKISATGKAAAQHTVRVEADRLDNFLNLIGELVMKDGSLRRLTQDIRLKELTKPFKELSRLVEDARQMAVQLRMVRVEGLFRKMERVVRDASLQAGKEIVLHVAGAETELDRTLVESLHDPLVHIMRNAVDHGIESRAGRLAAGKPETGNIFLTAAHRGGGVELEIRDDGVGLDYGKILAKARAKGIADNVKEYTATEIQNFIFHPGFSTADAVTQISGRGVGMDVVRKNISALRGIITLESETGNGTTIRLRMPLTLAMIDGFLVKSAGDNFIIPLETMKECVDFKNRAHESAYAHKIYSLRGEPLPYLRLSDFFSLKEADTTVRESLIVVESGQLRFGIVVDEPLGEYQVVVKPLTGFLAGVRGIGGVTMLGAGDIALVLDMPGIVGRISGLQKK